MALDFDDAEGDITSQHYAFLVEEGEFDEICFLKDMRAFYARAAEPKDLATMVARRSI